MSERARNRLVQRFLDYSACWKRFPERRAANLEAIDQVLDEYLGNSALATEWDADMWGLPTMYMNRLLQNIEDRGGPLWPTEKRWTWTARA